MRTLTRLSRTAMLAVSAETEMVTLANDPTASPAPRRDALRCARHCRKIAHHSIQAANKIAERKGDE